MANGNNRKSEAPWFREIGAGSQPLKRAVETVLGSPPMIPRPAPVPGNGGNGQTCAAKKQAAAAAGTPMVNRAGMPKPSPASLAAAGSQNIDALVAKVRAALLKNGMTMSEEQVAGVVKKALLFHENLTDAGVLGGGTGGGVRP